MRIIVNQPIKLTTHETRIINEAQPMRKTFKLTDEQVKELLEAGRPGMYLVAAGTEPISPQERVNDIWKRLGKEQSFVWDSASPIAGMGIKYFSAEVLQ